MWRNRPKTFFWLYIAASAVAPVVTTGNHGSAKAANVLKTVSFDAYYDIGSVGSPKLSPDGQWVVFAEEHMSESDLMLVTGF